jgi:hypothetical protein
MNLSANREKCLPNTSRTLRYTWRTKSLHTDYSTLYKSVNGLLVNLSSFFGLYFRLCWILFSKIFPFLEKLFVFKTSDKFYQKLIGIRKHSRWANLVGFTGPDAGFRNKYLDCAKLFGEKMEFFSIREKYAHFGSGGMRAGYESVASEDFPKRLDYFPNLKNLEFERYTNDGIDSFDVVFRIAGC